MAADANRSFFYTVKSWIHDHVKLYRLLSFFKKNVLGFSNETSEQLWEKCKSIAVSKYLNKAEPFEYRDIRTILTPAYRLSVLNFDDPRISEGLEICLKSFKIMHDRLTAEGIKFYVLFIPTKELVFSEQAKKLNSPDYTKLVIYEEQMWEATRKFLNKNNIKYIDALPLLQDQIRAGRRVYPMNDDGHPLAAGCHAIAETAARFLEKILNENNGRTEYQ